jgi:hypothetical protein
MVWQLFQSRLQRLRDGTIQGVAIGDERVISRRRPMGTVLAHATS